MVGHPSSTSAYSQRNAAARSTNGASRPYDFGLWRSDHHDHDARPGRIQLVSGSCEGSARSVTRLDSTSVDSLSPTITTRQGVAQGSDEVAVVSPTPIASTASGKAMR